MNDSAVLRLARTIFADVKAPVSVCASEVEAAIDERFDARIEARMRELAPDMFKDAPVPPESIMGEPGDTFAGVSTNAAGSPYTVTAIKGGMRVMIGADGYTYHAILGMLRDPALFRLVKRGAGGSPNHAADSANAGSLTVPLFSFIIPPKSTYSGDGVLAANEGEYARSVAVYYTPGVDEPWRTGDGGGPGRPISIYLDPDGYVDARPMALHIRNNSAKRLRFDVRVHRAVVPAEMAVIADEPSDLDGPAGDVTAGRLTVAAEMLRETDAAVRDLIRVWHAYNHDKSVYTTHADFNATVEALAKCASLPVPWLRPT